jgi:hypothetical protein
VIHQLGDAAERIQPFAGNSGHEVFGRREGNQMAGRDTCHLQRLATSAARYRSPIRAPRPQSSPSRSTDGFRLAMMVTENVFGSNRRSLSAVTDIEFGVQMAQLCLDRVLADVEVNAQFAIRHAGREKG